MVLALLTAICGAASELTAVKRQRLREREAPPLCLWGLTASDFQNAIRARQYNRSRRSAFAFALDHWAFPLHRLIAHKARTKLSTFIAKSNRIVSIAELKGSRRELAVLARSTS